MQDIYNKLSTQSKLEASIGLSRKWNAREAGREVARSAMKKLKRPPSFILLFSTIHYKKHGGFQELLDGVWEILPEGTPLIGGTVAGFINNSGSFTRGVTVLAVSYPNMDVALGIGSYTKLNPKKSATYCSKMLKRKLQKSKYKNKFLVNVVSGPTVPFGKINVVKSNFLGWIVTHFGYKLFTLMGAGVGKEEDVIDKLADELPDYYIIGGSSVDSWKMFYNYQFIGDQVHTNSLVAIGCSIDKPVFLKSIVSLHKTQNKFVIDKWTSSGRIIKKIDNKPAKEQFLKQIGIVEEQFKDLGPFYYRTSNYFPISFEENEKYTSGVAGFLGNNIALGHKVRGKNVVLLSITGKEILKSIDETFELPNVDKLPFVFMFSSSIFLNTLGSKSHYLKDNLDRRLDNTPYLMVCPSTENAGTPKDHAVARVYSFNALSIDSNKE